MSRKENPLPQKKKTLFVSIGAAALALLLAAGALLFLFLPPGTAKEIREIPLPAQGEDALKIAVLSDSLLNRAESAEGLLYLNHTRAALALLKQQQVSLILFAGNLTASADAKEYALFNDQLAEVYDGEESVPPVVAAMGAGELAGAATVAVAQRTFAKAMGQPPRTRATAGGVQVIALGADQTKAEDPYSAKALRWLEAELAAAADTANGKPIFVLTPCPPDGTVDGSGVAGKKLVALLQKYPNVISVSGGTHRPQLSENMITQGAYTAVGSQGLSFVELAPGYYDPQQGEAGLEDAIRPQQADERPFALIFAFARNKITVQRWNVLDQTQEREAAAWSLYLPLATETFHYDPERRAAVNEAPHFPVQDVFAVSTIPGAGGKELDGVAFTPAADDARVAAYDLEATNRLNVTLVKRYAADTFLGAGAAAKTALALDPTLPSGEYSIRVYAVDDFGRRSTGFLECTLTHTKTAA
ncbi:MAG: hypothetical protein LBS96_02035 [Oscillospiraceae bacterium]|jgi:hypothetical protein|nr:hypothetical protein [Oscillospiraceae bacterium]